MKPPPPGRTQWEGIRKVVAFNPTHYLLAGVILGITFTYLRWEQAPGRLPVLMGALALTWFVLASLAAIHWIYDRSDLYRWSWLERCWPPRPLTALLPHAGFDEVSHLLRAAFPGVTWTAYNFHDPVLMTERSLNRAIRLYPSADSLRGPFDRWPFHSGSTDLVLFMTTAHELRTPARRVALLREAQRVLRDTGRVILVEHVRDAPNFAVFGPGALHFHSEAAWRRDWTEAGLKLERSFRVTAFIRGWVLTRSASDGTISSGPGSSWKSGPWPGD